MDGDDKNSDNEFDDYSEDDSPRIMTIRRVPGLNPWIWTVGLSDRVLNSEFKIRVLRQSVEAEF